MFELVNSSVATFYWQAFIDKNHARANVIRTIFHKLYRRSQLADVRLKRSRLIFEVTFCLAAFLRSHKKTLQVTAFFPRNSIRAKQLFEGVILKTRGKMGLLLIGRSQVDDEYSFVYTAPDSGVLTLGRRKTNGSGLVDLIAFISYLITRHRILATN